MKLAVFGKKFENDLSEFCRILLDNFKDSPHKFDTAYFDTTVEQDDSDLQSLFKRIETILFDNDVVVIEASKHSTGIGAIMGLCFVYKKPLLLLYNEEEHEQMSTIISATATTKRSLTVMKYYSKESLGRVVEDFIKEAKSATKTKFFINLDSDINRYLEWWSHQNDRPKVDLIRDLLNKHISHDDDWHKIGQSLK